MQSKGVEVDCICALRNSSLPFQRPHGASLLSSLAIIIVRLLPLPVPPILSSLCLPID